MVLILDDHPIARQGLASLIELHFPQQESHRPVQYAKLKRKWRKKKQKLRL